MTDATITYQIKFPQQQLSMLTVKKIETKLKYVNEKNSEFANKSEKCLAEKGKRKENDIENKRRIMEVYRKLTLTIILICIKHKLFP